VAGDGGVCRGWREFVGAGVVCGGGGVCRGWGNLRGRGWEFARGGVCLQGVGEFAGG